MNLISKIKGFEKIDKGVVSCAVLASTSNDFCSGYDLHDVASQGIDGNEHLTKNFRKKIIF